MNKDIAHLFSETDIRAPHGLKAAIVARIDAESRRSEERQRTLWASFSCLSFAGFVASGWYAAEAFASSNFGSYFSLLFSGGSLRLWKEIGLALLDSLPVVGIGIVLFSVAALLWSVRRFARHGARASFLRTAA